ncbi:uncharacterized protein N7483_000279 [Penicillium malachiteum]|uniref:uncharacterized protein n=1 Tax=Penicillium malachiteum TaxID=1324776 RepID=UPI0025495312|nr:uncharacterized protein N7483_000279 [Penicillium malachiteum]KAJ5735154.1 hypothetical protein N7483_000279 [Penicillium malachiteum]
MAESPHPSYSMLNSPTSQPQTSICPLTPPPSKTCSREPTSQAKSEKTGVLVRTNKPDVYTSGWRNYQSTQNDPCTSPP